MRCCIGFFLYTIVQKRKKGKENLPIFFLFSSGKPRELGLAIGATVWYNYSVESADNIQIITKAKQVER